MAFASGLRVGLWRRDGNSLCPQHVSKRRGVPLSSGCLQVLRPSSKGSLHIGVLELLAVAAPQSSDQVIKQRMSSNLEGQARCCKHHHRGRLPSISAQGGVAAVLNNKTGKDAS